MNLLTTYKNGPKFVKEPISVMMGEPAAIDITASLRGAAESLRDAAVDAAYRASFNAMIAHGVPVVAKGIIDYQFVLPK